MSKDLKIGLLNQIYGRLLTENQRAVAAYYYDDDLSLGEIAEQFGITRQGVRDYIKRAESRLLELEEELHLLARLEEQDRAARSIIALCDKLAGEMGASADLKEIARLAGNICIWDEKPV